MTHMHITAWTLGFILFIIALIFYKKGNQKTAAIAHMILRMGYLFIFITGGLLTWGYFQGSEIPMLGEVIVKAIAGGWIVVMMEFILIGTKKGKANKADWIQFWLALVIVAVLGFFRLPMGFHFLQ